MERPVRRSTVHWRSLGLSAALIVAAPAWSGAQSLDVLHNFSGYSVSEGPKAALTVATDGQLYGTTRGGGTYNKGTIFRISPAGNVTVLHSFAGPDGASPETTLVRASDGRLYGLAAAGGTSRSYGTAFRIEPDGTFSLLHTFGGPGDGAIPTVILQATDGNFYGIATYYIEPGGTTNFSGAAFRMTPDGSVTILHVFPAQPDGNIPTGLIQSSDGNFIGTRLGSSLDGGSVFRMTPSGAVTILHTFPSGGGDGRVLLAGVIEASDGNFYGTTGGGGASGYGTVFRMTSAGVVTMLHDFAGGLEGARPRGQLLEAADGNLYGTASEGYPANAQGSAFKITLGGVFTLLHSFSGRPDGAHPQAGLVQGPDGRLYGTTPNGGAVDFGTVFTIEASGTVTTLYEFSGSVEGTGANALTRASDGNFYGTTCSGGVNNAGTVFRITRTSVFTGLYTFLGTTDGSCPQGLVQANDGMLYGVTSSKGAVNAGTIFRLTLDGSLSVLYSFTGGSDGGSPAAGLTVAADGRLYGTTSSGGAGLGTVFRLTALGAPVVVHNFFGGTTDGARPTAALLQGSDGNLYGFTPLGGFANKGVVFRMTPSGFVTVLHAFSGNTADGETPGALVEGADHQLYGAANYHVVMTPNTHYRCGRLFRLSPDGIFTGMSSLNSYCYGLPGPFSAPAPGFSFVVLRSGALIGTVSISFGTSSRILTIAPDGQVVTLYAFSGSEGASVTAALIEDTDGKLYGVAAQGGTFGGGTIFRLRYTPGAPDVLTVSAAGAQVRLAWTAVAGAVSYTIKRASASGAQTTLATGVQGTEYLDTTTVPGQTYYYLVTATNAFGEDASYEVSITPGRTVPGDFDGDGKTDIAVYRPSTGVWYIRPSSTGGLTAITWGVSTDLPVPGDYDGDGKIDAAVFRPSTGLWYIRSSMTGGLTAITWGVSTDIPVPGDYDGDGLTDAAVFRPSTGVWYIRQSRTFTMLAILWGDSTDTPVPGDYDGDGKTDVAVFRASINTWYMRQSSTFALATSHLGLATDTPVASDYDSDGKADVAVFSGPARTWNVEQSGRGTESTITWGDPSDVPVPGDYDGDGRYDVAVFRPATGVWYIRYSSTGAMLSGPWGGSIDIPVLRRP